ncbi:MAG TPA: response regulator [Gammaproteobacteria bacterium]|nr:response regulator [Gammaproteobacteria bacterium]
MSDDESTGPRADSPSKARKSGRRARATYEVLLVEDDRDAATLMRLFLEKAGHGVATAADGPAALAAAATRGFDTVILDLGLPDLSGSEVLRELKKRPHLRRTRFICLSGRRERDVDWRTLGFDHYLEKPVPFPELAKLLGPRSS